jgi:uracil-DNA glycosylase
VSQTDGAAGLARLDEEVRACTRCDLHIGTNNGVPGEGPSDAEIMFVGEAPGFNEDKQGRPFVGAAGRFLEELLAVAGLQRSDVYITNVVKHRPPNNRDPLPAELTACRPYLEQQIKLINPRVIVTLGRFSLGTFLPGTMISKVHGQLEERDGRYIFPMYHPAAALHQEKLRQTLLDDMKKLATFLQGPYKKADRAAQDASEDEDPPEQLRFF